MRDPHFYLLKPEQQIATLLYALRRPRESALIILNRFEWLLSQPTPQEIAMHGQVVLFLEMLLADLGPSRILLTAFDYTLQNNTASDTREELSGFAYYDARRRGTLAAKGHPGSTPRIVAHVAAL